MRTVEDTHKETKGRVLCGPGISEEFRMDVGLRRECLKLSRTTCTNDIVRKLL